VRWLWTSEWIVSYSDWVEVDWIVNIIPFLNTTSPLYEQTDEGKNFRYSVICEIDSKYNRWVSLTDKLDQDIIIENTKVNEVFMDSCAFTQEWIYNLTVRKISSNNWINPEFAEYLWSIRITSKIPNNWSSKIIWEYLPQQFVALKQRVQYEYNFKSWITNYTEWKILDLYNDSISYKQWGGVLDNNKVFLYQRNEDALIFFEDKIWIYSNICIEDIYEWKIINNILDKWDKNCSMSGYWLKLDPVDIRETLINKNDWNTHISDYYAFRYPIGYEVLINQDSNNKTIVRSWDLELSIYETNFNITKFENNRNSNLVMIENSINTAYHDIHWNEDFCNNYYTYFEHSSNKTIITNILWECDSNKEEYYTLIMIARSIEMKYNQL
jgi:hypothetical protein